MNHFQKKFMKFHREFTVYKFVNKICFRAEFFNFSALKISESFIAMKMANTCNFLSKKLWPTIALTGPPVK